MWTTGNRLAQAPYSTQDGVLEHPLSTTWGMQVRGTR